MANHNSLAFSDHMMFADSWLPYLVVACIIVLRKYNIWVGGLLLIEEEQNTNNQNEGALFLVCAIFITENKSFF